MGSRAATRLSKADWLARALEALTREGETELRIDRLTSYLGVTKGSFYWHFEDRADFVRELAEFWDSAYTTAVRERIRDLDTGPSEKLMALMRAITEQELARYDVVMRAWGNHNPVVARIVRAVDRERSSIVRDLFAAIGFEGEELERRTRLFVTYMSFESNLSLPRSKKRRLGDLPMLHELFTHR